jgi:folate-dependent phosphoribosylglycinamide formyltransferase PurN
MQTKPIFDPEKQNRPMRVAAFMSGSGTNIIKLIEKENTLKQEEGSSPFNVVFIFSDRSDGHCKGEEIARKYGIPYFSYDIREFHNRSGVKRTVLTQDGLDARKKYDRVAGTLVKAFEVDAIALGGYMSYITLDRCVNVHPADLSILTDDGKRRYVGDNAVRDAIIAGEKTLRSSTLWADEGVDTGPLLMVSGPMEVNLPEPLESLLNNKDKLIKVIDEHQYRLKETGDWIIFPRTVEMIARGRFSLDKDRNVYVDGNHVPEGYRE